jgi:hypothetical protein
VIGSAEEGIGSEAAIDPCVKGILRPIVVGDGASERFGKNLESLDRVAGKFIRRSSAQFSKDGKARFSLVKDEQNG